MCDIHVTHVYIVTSIWCDLIHFFSLQRVDIRTFELDWANELCRRFINNTKVLVFCAILTQGCSGRFYYYLPQTDGLFVLSDSKANWHSSLLIIEMWWERESFLTSVGSRSHSNRVIESVRVNSLLIRLSTGIRVDSKISFVSFLIDATKKKNVHWRERKVLPRRSRPLAPSTRVKWAIFLYWFIEKSSGT